MNYHKIYENLIYRSKNRTLFGYKERHHIIPRCIGGTDDIENIAELTPEEHYLAHQLLVKMYPTNNKLLQAAMMMIPDRKSNKLYGWLRRKFSEYKSKEQSGVGNSQYGTKWITNGLIEKKILKNETVPENWFEQRLSSYLKKIEKEKTKEEKHNKKINYLRELHNVYIKEGYEGVRKIGYKYSQPNLVAAFEKYLPEFVSQNGKKRKVD